MDYSFLSSPCAAALWGIMLQDTDNGRKEFSMSYPMLEERIHCTTKQIRNSLQKLIQCNVIKGQFKGQGKGHFSTFIITCNISICKPREIKKGTNKGSFEGTNKDLVNEQFEKLWIAYGRKGVKQTAKSRWLKLDDDERAKAIAHAPIYSKLTVRQYTKGMEVYINQKYWETPLMFFGLEYSLKTQFPDDTTIRRFLEWYNKGVDNTRLAYVEKLNEERRVIINAAFGYFSKEEIFKAVSKALKDPYNSGAMPLIPGRRIPTFEDIMNPNNIIKTND